MGRLRIVRFLAAGAGAQPNSHTPAISASYLEESVAQGPNFVARRDDKFQVGVANFDGSGDRVFAIPTNEGFGKWQPIKP